MHPGRCFGLHHQTRRRGPTRVIVARMAVPLNEPEPDEADAAERKLLALEIDLLLMGMAERYGYDFRNYARASLTRRIRKAVQNEGVGSISELQSRLLHDAEAAMRFVASMSVHTTSMFR